jgi:predicted permease
MRDVPKWRRYLRFWRADVEGDVDEELRFHFEARTAELRARGATAEEARRQATEEFGDEDAVRAHLHAIDHRMERRRARFLWWDAARADLRYALRGLRANPLFTGAVVLTLAVGIGAATTMYGVMRRLLIQPPPGVVAPDVVRRLFFRYEEPGEAPHTYAALSYPFFEEIRDDRRVLDAVAVYDRAELPVGQGADAELVDATLVSAGFWRTLGARPALGRFIADDEAHPATGSRVVVLGHAFWQRRFGGDPAVLGRVVRVKGLPYEVVGVAPRGFRGVELAGTDVWLPLFASADDGSARTPDWHTYGSSSNLAFVARLRPGVPLAQAQAELSRRFDAFIRRVEGEMFGSIPELMARTAATRRTVHLGSLTGALGNDMTRIPEATVSVWLVGVAGVLLVIACANVGSLLLMRALRRRREIGVRLALGMSRRRLAALLLVESLLLAVLGGVASAAVIVAGGAWVRRVLLAGMSAERAGFDWDMLFVAAGCTLGVALVTGLVPVLQTRRGGMAGLRDGGQHGATRRSRVHWTLLVAQTALSVVLLVGAGLFLHSLRRITTLDLGLDTRNVLAVQVDFSGSGRRPLERAAFYQRALERVRALPGVEHAAVAQTVPLRTTQGGLVRLPGAEKWLRPESGSPLMNFVGDDFFAATGMRLVRGRGITAADLAGPPVVVINEALARAGWPDGSPIGACVNTSDHPDDCVTVVGVVGNAHTFRLREEQRFWFYKPLARDDGDVGVLLVRQTPGVAGVAATLRRTLRDLDPTLPYIDVAVLGDVLDPQIRPWRLGATLFTTFGVIAMLLAALGLYAAVAYAVTQRTREIGVRVAVGATAGSVVRLVLGDGARVALVGIAAGLGLALIGAPFIADLLFDVSPRDPLVLLGVGGGVLLAALLASLLPARRAARVDPVTALRVD